MIIGNMRAFISYYNLSMMSCINKTAFHDSISYNSYVYSTYCQQAGAGSCVGVCVGGGGRSYKDMRVGGDLFTYSLTDILVDILRNIKHGLTLEKT